MEAVSKQLQVGMAVALEELLFGYRLTVLTDGQAGHQVVEIATDYIVLEDPASGVRRRLPMFMLKPVAPAVEVSVPQAAVA
jgi:hypothetical protein